MPGRHADNHPLAFAGGAILVVVALISAVTWLDRRAPPASVTYLGHDGRGILTLDKGLRASGVLLPDRGACCSALSRDGREIAFETTRDATATDDTFGPN